MRLVEEIEARNLSLTKATMSSLPRLVFCLFLVVAVPSFLAAKEPAPPNVVLFLVDDLGWRDLGCFGSTFYETPNVDHLAATGMRFTQAYAACPVCSPTRASILTGKYPQRAGVTDYIAVNRSNQPEKWSRRTRLLPAPYSDRLALSETTLAEALKQAGYATFFAGKWHLGPQGYYPEDQGFDVNKGGLEWGAPSAGKRYFSPYGNPKLPDGPPGEHLPARLAAETAAFISAHRERPFLAYLSFYSVHVPLMAREDLLHKYEAKAKKLQLADPAWGTERGQKVRLVQNLPVYAAMVEAMDQAVGTVLHKLDELDLADRTIVIFMSDNGGLATSEGHPTSNLPLRAGKGWLYEGGIREPMIIRAPGTTKPGTTCDTPVISTDFFPSILELCGHSVTSGQQIDGRSFVPLLKGESLNRGPIFWHYPHYGNQGGAPSGAVRDGDWKLIEWYEDGARELFNIREDIGEHRNRAAEMPDKVRDLAAKLDAWRHTVGAIMPTLNAKTAPKRSS
jgi:arylsulfatase A-like enzyme